MFQPIRIRRLKSTERFKFWGGITLLVSGGGPGLIDALVDACARQEIGIQYGARAERLIEEEGAVKGVIVRLGADESRSAAAPSCWPQAL